MASRPLVRTIFLKELNIIDLEDPNTILYTTRLFRSQFNIRDEHLLMNIDPGDEIDKVLDLEQQYYQEGYEEGQREATHHQFIEGKEYGYQTGFQRFIIIGYMRGVAEIWRKEDGKTIEKSMESHLNQLDRLLDVPMTNGDSEVAVYEKNVAKARNKLRVIATIRKDQARISKLDQLVDEIGGKLQVSENVDEMW